MVKVYAPWGWTPTLHLGLKPILGVIRASNESTLCNSESTTLTCRGGVPPLLPLHRPSGVSLGAVAIGPSTRLAAAGALAKARWSTSGLGKGGRCHISLRIHGCKVFSRGEVKFFAFCLVAVVES